MDCAGRFGASSSSATNARRHLERFRYDPRHAVPLSRGVPAESPGSAATASAGVASSSLSNVRGHWESMRYELEPRYKAMAPDPTSHEPARGTLQACRYFVGSPLPGMSSAAPAMRRTSSADSYGSLPAGLTSERLADFSDARRRSITPEYCRRRRASSAGPGWFGEACGNRRRHHAAVCDPRWGWTSAQPSLEAQASTRFAAPESARSPGRRALTPSRENPLAYSGPPGAPVASPGVRLDGTTRPRHIAACHPDYAPLTPSMETRNRCRFELVSRGAPSASLEQPTARRTGGRSPSPPWACD